MLRFLLFHDIVLVEPSGLTSIAVFSAGLLLLISELINYTQVGTEKQEILSQSE